MKILMYSRLIRQILTTLKAVFSGTTQARKGCSGVCDLQDGAEVFYPHDARPEVFFIFAEQFPKNNSLLILSFLHFYS